MESLKQIECESSIAIVGLESSDMNSLSATLKSSHEINIYEDIQDIAEYSNYEMIILISKQISPCLLNTIQEIKSSTFEPPVILLYSLSEVLDRHKLIAFKSGADDICNNGFSSDEILLRVNRFIEYKRLSSKYKKELSEQKGIIQTSIAQASQYGSILQLISSINKCYTYSSLADSIFNYLSQSGLDASLMIDNGTNKSFYDSETGICTPIIAKVLDSLKDKRLHSCGSKTIFSASNVSLLIKNMPVGQFNYDLYVDVFASLIESIESRVNSIIHIKNMEESVSEISDIVSLIDKGILKAQQNKQVLMDEIILNIGQSFHILDLNEEQEEFLTDMISNTVKKHAENAGEFNNIRTMASHAIDTLEFSILNDENNDNLDGAANDEMEEDVLLF